MKNLKPDRIRFTKEAARIITEHGGEQAGSYRYNSHIPNIMDCEWYIIKTNNNRLRLTIHNELDHCLVYSVFGMLELPDPRVGNPSSGKVNFHMQGELSQCWRGLRAGWRIY